MTAALCEGIARTARDKIHSGVFVCGCAIGNLTCFRMDQIEMVLQYPRSGDAGAEGLAPAGVLSSLKPAAEICSERD